MLETPSVVNQKSVQDIQTVIPRVINTGGSMSLTGGNSNGGEGGSVNVISGGFNYESSKFSFLSCCLTLLQTYIPNTSISV